MIHLPQRLFHTLTPTGSYPEKSFFKVLARGTPAAHDIIPFFSTLFLNQIRIARSIHLSYPLYFPSSDLIALTINPAMFNLFPSSIDHQLLLMSTGLARGRYALYPQTYIFYQPLGYW